jgi:hypothetical protein
VIWFLWPSRAVATALFRVARENPVVLKNESSPWRDEREFEVIKKTQIALLNSEFVLTAAVRDPDISSLSIFASVEDPVKWIQEHLDVSYPEDGEILEIKLAGPQDRADDLVHLVDAVVRAYQKEVIDRDRQRELSQRDLVARNLKNVKEEIARKSDELDDIGVEASTLLDTDTLSPDIKWLAPNKAEVTRFDSDRKEMLDGLPVAEPNVQVDAKAIRISIDLRSHQRELELLQRVADELFVTLKRMDINATAPIRIELLQRALIEAED